MHLPTSAEGVISKSTLMESFQLSVAGRHLWERPGCDVAPTGEGREKLDMSGWIFYFFLNSTEVQKVGEEGRSAKGKGAGLALLLELGGGGRKKKCLLFRNLCEPFGSKLGDETKGSASYICMALTP